MNNAEEHALFEALGAGDSGAAEALVEGTYQMVYATQFRLCGDRHLAEDLTQETYRKAWGALAGFDGRSKFSTWLYRIAYNTFLNHTRRPLRLVEINDENIDGWTDPAQNQEEDVHRQQMTERLRAAVARLPDSLRFTVVGYYWAGLPVRSLASLEGISRVAIRKRLKRALDVLCDGMQEGR